MTISAASRCHDVHVLNAYVDESYSSDFYYIAAALGTPQAWTSVATEFDRIRQQTAQLHGTPLDAEFHGHELMGGSGDWVALRGKHREAAGVFRAALRACRTAGIEFILRGADVERLNARYRYPQQPHSIVFGHFLERCGRSTRRLPSRAHGSTTVSRQPTSPSTSTVDVRRVQKLTRLRPDPDQRSRRSSTPRSSTT